MHSSGYKTGEPDADGFRELGHSLVGDAVSMSSGPISLPLDFIASESCAWSAAVVGIDAVANMP